MLKGNLFNERYRLTKLLGRGGFSEVWLVEDTRVSDKKMALKVYAPGIGLDDNGVKLFSSEFELVFDFNHSNLLRLAHFDVCDCSPYLILPYCKHGSTVKLIGGMAVEEAWRFLRDVSAGLVYLHGRENPVIHQDIKPDNVLIDDDGNYLITDFGISAKARGTLRRSVSNAKLSGGTIAYMPPERFGKEKDPIKASDVWALGATLFELMTGDVPFGEHGGLIQKSGAEIPNIDGDYSQDLKIIVQKMLANEPCDRPTAEQLMEWTVAHFKGYSIPVENGIKIEPHDTVSHDVPKMLANEPCDRPTAEQLMEWTEAHFKGDNIPVENVRKIEPCDTMPRDIAGKDTYQYFSPLSLEPESGRGKYMLAVSVATVVAIVLFILVFTYTRQPGTPHPQVTITPLASEMEAQIEKVIPAKEIKAATDARAKKELATKTSGQNKLDELSELRKKAEQGDAVAQFSLGLMYASGRGVQRSDTEAVNWYRKAAEQGNASAQNNLGFMYENGRGVQRSDTEAVNWYRKAAEQGNASAQNNLGFMYENGHGMRRSVTEAVNWYRKAAEQGNEYAQKALDRLKP